MTRNCTSSLIQYANESRPGALPWHYSWIFTGKVDEYLAELGYLDPHSAVHPRVPGRERSQVIVCGTATSVRATPAGHVCG